MNNKLLLTLLFLAIGLTSHGQIIEIVRDLRSGSQSGFREGYTNYKGEMYFVGVDAGPSFVEVFSVNEDLVITKRLSAASEIRGASILESTDEYLYVYNRESGSVRDLYRSSGTNASLQLVAQFTDEIDQSESLSDGIVFIEEDTDQKRRIHYVADDEDSSTIVAEGLDLGDLGMEITETATHIIFSPWSYADYDGKVLAFDKSTSALDTNYLKDLCPDMKFAYAFRTHLVYTCEGEYFVHDFITQSDNQLPIDGRFALREGPGSRSFSSGEEYIILKPTEEDILVSISKENLNAEVIAERVFSYVDLLDGKGKLYFFRQDNGFFLEESNGDGSDRREVLDDDIVTLRDGVIVNNQAHLLYGNDQTRIARINDDGTLENLAVLERSNLFIYDRFIAKVGENVIYPSFESETGLELYALSYNGVSVEDHRMSSVNVFPNPTRDGQVYFDERVKYVTVTDIQGKTIFSAWDANKIDISSTGIFVLNGILKDGTSFVERVVVK